ncbi:MAG: choice-of-anchor D domain-containing protein [Verrucomicrobia bacterium]|nr:choice-of-anchor D domain-containing protein [Verrucomicrobiota bacterium]
MEFASQSGQLSTTETIHAQATISAAYLTAGQHSGEIVLRSNDPLADFINIPIRLLVADSPGLLLPRAEIDFGAVVPGSSATRNLRIANSGTQTLVIQELHFADVAFGSNQALPITIPAGQSLDIPIQFSPQEARAHNSSITFTTNLPYPSNQTAVLTGSGPLPPVLEASADTVRITVPAGAQLSTQITFSNSGQGPLNLTALLRTEAIKGGAGVSGNDPLHIARSGGPDSFGYTFKDDTEEHGAFFQWDEIAVPMGGSGVELTPLTGRPRDSNGNNPGAFVTGLPLTFEFPFYGTERQEMAVSAYGAVYFDAAPKVSADGIFRCPASRPTKP